MMVFFRTWLGKILIGKDFLKRESPTSRLRVNPLLRISPYSVRMRENAGKMWTRITPNTDSFYAVY